MKIAKLFFLGALISVFIFSCGNETDGNVKRLLDSISRDSSEKAYEKKHEREIQLRDTVNRIDKHGLRQGYWKLTGTMVKDVTYTAEGIVKAGRYVDGKEEGIWIEHSPDGKTEIKTNYHEGKVVR